MALIRASPILPCRVATASFSWYLRFQFRKFGTATMVKKPIIATIIVTSVRVKPAFALSRGAIPACIDVIGLLLKQSGCLGSITVRHYLISILISICYELFEGGALEGLGTPEHVD